MAIKTSPLKKIVTGKAIAIFPSIDREATYLEDGKAVKTGNFESKFKLMAAKDQAELIALIDKTWADVCKDPQKYGLKASVFDKIDEEDPNLPYSEDKEGNVVFKTTSKVSWEDKKGVVHDRVIPVFDAKAKKVTVSITSNSVVKFNVTLQPYAMNKKVYGVKLRLEAVQLLELGQMQAHNPFEAEDEYEGIEDEAANAGFEPEDEGFDGEDAEGDGDF